LIDQRPSLVRYVLTRLILIVVGLSGLYAVILWSTPVVYQTPTFHFVLLVTALLVLVGSVYVGLKRIVQELQRIETYLLKSDLLKAKKEVFFLTQEFECIHTALISVLRKIKKKERKKRKYTAKIKLKNRQRSDMLSAIAHEFRNPIAAIMGYSQTLNEDEEIPAPLRQKFLSKIYNNGEKIEELLSRLLLWNRFESGEQKLHLSHIEMHGLIKEVVSHLEDKYKNREIIVDNGELMVKADRALMEIVIKNLIENALKYSKDVVHVRIEGRRVMVIDYGIGIAEENIEKVTKKFFRTSEHTWDNSMGLGLAIVKEILKLHQTTLEIKSQEDQGSTFSFQL